MDKVNLGKECAVEENVDTINGSESEMNIKPGSSFITESNDIKETLYGRY